MNQSSGLNVINVNPHFDDSGPFVCVAVQVEVQSPAEFDIDDITEDVTKSLAESYDPHIEQRVRRILTERWPGRSYSIRWPMIA